MYSHMMVGSNDLARSKKFYDATFVAAGLKAGNEDPKGRIVYAQDNGLFIVTRPINGEAATHGNGSTIGFTMTAEQADAWHAAGVANGGSAVEDAPGIRTSGSGAKVYLAYLRDPDGNKLCAVQRLAA